jgi:serine/threonine-protein kinase RsbW
VAAHADLTVEQIDDLRLAVDEAFALLISQQSDLGEVSVEFTIENESLTVELTGPKNGPEVDRSTFSWTVLQALVAEVKTKRNIDNSVILTLTTKVVASA